MACKSLNVRSQELKWAPAIVTFFSAKQKLFFFFCFPKSREGLVVFYAMKIKSNQFDQGK